MRFQTWDEARVITPANVRREPNGEIVGRLTHGARVVIIGGPIERNNLTWWQVRNGLSGWVAEDAPNRAVLLDKWDDTPFGKAMGFVLLHEGGESNIEADSGGYTKWGIASRYNPGVPVAQLTLDQAKKIYRDKYWTPCGADKLPWPLALTVFDMAVNAGVGTALNLLQAVGNDFTAYNGARRSYYHSLSTFVHFGQGWLNRVSEVEKYA